MVTDCLDSGFHRSDDFLRKVFICKDIIIYHAVR